MRVDNEVLCANWFSERSVEREELVDARRNEIKSLWKP
jgi:hypothetical protein